MEHSRINFTILSDFVFVALDVGGGAEYEPFTKVNTPGMQSRVPGCHDSCEKSCDSFNVKPRFVVMPMVYDQS